MSECDSHPNLCEFSLDIVSEYEINIDLEIRFKVTKKVFHKTIKFSEEN